MLKNCHYIIIQLLIAAIVSLGIAHAGGDVCPPACTHCGSKVIVTCCDDMAGHAEGHADAQRTDRQKSEQCEHGSFCPGTGDADNVVAQFTLPKSDYAVALLPGMSPAVIITVQYTYAEPPQGPPPEKNSSIYTLNCVYLI